MNKHGSITKSCGCVLGLACAHFPAHVVQRWEQPGEAVNAELARRRKTARANVIALAEALAWAVVNWAHVDHPGGQGCTCGCTAGADDILAHARAYLAARHP